MLGGAAAAEGREVWSAGDASVEVGGSVKEIARATRGTDGTRFQQRVAADPRCLRAATFPDCGAFALVGEKSIWQSLTRARLRVDARANRHLSAELVYDHELLAGTLDTLGDDLGEAFLLDPFLDLAWDVRVAGMPTDHRRWRHLLYRANVRLELGRFETRVGRQRIPWGVGRLWNPADRFNAIPPLAIEQDQSRGVDAVLARWNVDGFTFAEAIYQPGATSDEAAWGGRVHGVVGEMDWSLLGGRWERDWAAGFDLAGNLRGAAFRVEAIWTRPTRDVWPVGAPVPRRNDPFWQIVVSLDYNVPVGRGLYVLVEHFYNGNALGFGRGEAGTLLPFFESTATPPPGVPAAAGPFVKPASPAVFGGSRLLSNARHQSGVQLGYDLTPILRADLLTLVDWNGGSVVVAPILSYSPLGSLELVLGAQLFAGPRRSQYGPQDPLVYATAQWFF